jgi:hypothetical protein
MWPFANPNLPYVVEHQILAKSNRYVVWRAIADTQQLNYQAGMAAVQLRALDNFTAARFKVTTRQGGFAVVYEEEPYEWVQYEHFSVTRRFLQGPVRLYQMQFSLSDSKEFNRTCVILKVLILPRRIWLLPIVYLATKLSLLKIGWSIRRLLADRHKKSLATKVNRRELFQKLAPAMPQSGAELVKTLEDHLCGISDVEAYKLRPYALAKAWQKPRGEVLALFLHACADHALCARWAPICASCRAPIAQLPNKSAHLRCQLCDIALPSHPQAAYELLFSADPSWRSVDTALFCPGGPIKMPHVLCQKVMLAYGQVVLTAPSAPGHYTLRMRGGLSVELNVCANALVLCTTLQSVSPPKALDVKPGATLVVHNPQAYARHVKIEEVSSPDLAVRIGDLQRMELQGHSASLCKHLTEQLESQRELATTGG